MPLVLSKAAEYSFEEKKSKFIGYCMPVSTEIDAKGFVASIKAKHADATHNCFAYSVGSLARAGDDGEPSGTAGIPILNVFRKNKIVDFVCVVTRYYGGILLGAGGLVRAYSKATKGVLEVAGVEQRYSVTQYVVNCTYNQLSKVKHSLDKWGVQIISANYTDCCQMIVGVRDDLAEGFVKSELFAKTKLEPVC